jgi:nucleoid-associated protein YgaU
MTVNRTSRYRFGKYLQVEYEEGKFERFHELRSTTMYPPSNSVTYTTKAGDTFESLAYRLYGSSAKWYILADANPHIFYPLDLGSGQRIILPPRSYAELA